MNREQRRGAAKVAGSRTDRHPDRLHLRPEACKLCAYIASTLIGARAGQFRDPDGKLVEMPVNQRQEPPLGLRFPRAQQERSKCLECAGVGKLGCQACHGRGEVPVGLKQMTPCEACAGAGKIACPKCAGSGVNWIRSDYAPVCEECAQYLYAWIKLREQRHAAKLQEAAPASSRIILPTGRPQSGTGRIVLPGR